jgi:hypothetical protein
MTVSTLGHDRRRPACSRHTQLLQNATEPGLKPNTKGSFRPLKELYLILGLEFKDLVAKEATMGVNRNVDLPSRERERGTLSKMRHRIEQLGPYQSLVLLAVPISIVEPLKLVAVAIAGEGHWITGTLVIVAAYATSILAIERLFAIVKPKLLTLNWFARLWTWFVGLRIIRFLKAAKEAIFGWITHAAA